MDYITKIEIQILKSVIENETANDRLLPHISDKFFHNIGNQELFKLVQKHPKYNLDELELQIRLVPNAEIRKEVQKSVIEVKNCSAIKEDVLIETAERFIKDSMVWDLLIKASDDVMKHKDANFFDYAREIENFSLSTKKHTKTLSEIDSEDVQDYVWHCRDFIPVIEGKLIMVTGRGASGKGISMLRNAIEYLKANQQKKALLWNMEDSTQDIKIRLNTLRTNGLVIPENTLDRLEVLDSTKDFKLEELKRIFKDFSYVVIDPLSHLIEGEENDASKVKPVMKYFQSICNDENKIIILVHHEAKGSDGKGSKQGRGSSSFFDNVRLSYSMRYEDGRYHVETVKNNYGEFRESFEIDPWYTSARKMMGEKLSSELGSNEIGAMFNDWGEI
jgi:hypothetical protein